MKIFQEEVLQQFNHFYKELDDLYHEISTATGLSDSAFDVMYVVATLGDGCLQRDICREAFVSKQTVNSSVRNLEKKGFLLLEQHGRDKQIYLTDQSCDPDGKRNIYGSGTGGEKRICPSFPKICRYI